MRPLIACAALLTALAFGPAAAAGTDDPAHYSLVSPRVEAEGLMDDAAWERAAWIGNLYVFGTPRHAEVDRAEARVMHDERALYVSLRGDAQPKEAQGDRPERAEVFIDESPFEEGYLQIMVERTGGIRFNDRKPPFNRGDELARAADLVVAETPEGWAMRLAVPFEALGAEPPQPGDVYRLKVCRDLGREGPLSWPPNVTQPLGFHNRMSDGALYFETKNLLAEGDFDEAALGGPPEVWSSEFGVQPGAHYEFSVEADAALPSAALSAHALGPDGREVRSTDQEFRLGGEPERLRLYFEVPEGAPRVRLAVSAEQAGGKAAFRGAMLRKVLWPATTVAIPEPDEYTFDPEPDPLHGLEALVERHGHKPWDLYARGEDLLTRRTVFRDRRFGTQVWLVDDSPAVDLTGTACQWSAWNADGSLLYLWGHRIGPEGSERGWFANADHTRLLRTPASRGFSGTIWDRREPDVLFDYSRGQLAKIDARSGAMRLLAEWEPYRNERIYGLTGDNRYVFLDTPNGGLWIPREPREGAGPLPGPREAPAISVRTPYRTHLADTEEWGPVIRVRVGTLFDRQTGEAERVIAPMRGRDAYLQAFKEMAAEGRFPVGEGWDGRSVHASDDLDEMFAIYRYFPESTHGHTGDSPDAQYWAWDRGSIHATRSGERLDYPLSTGHIHWRKHPRFYLGWVRGCRLRPRGPNSNIIFQMFADKTYQPVTHTKHRFSNTWGTSNVFQMQSPDATKVHYTSNMTNRFQTYIAVMARPRPPRDLSWRAEGGAVELSWAPSAYSRETKGYLVYRSGRSGDGYELMTPEPVEGTSWRDGTVQAGQDYYYAVTSLEHSGLESGYSEEAARVGVDLPDGLDAPLVAYAEAEHSIRDLPTLARPGLAMGVDRWHASDWYYAYRHPDADSGEAELDVRVPAEGEYHVWARVRSADGGRAEWRIGLGGRTLAAATGSREWTWARASEEPVALEAGRAAAMLATSDQAAQLDLICLATDADFAPEGPRPEDTAPPPAPEGLRAENVRERVNHLVWQRPGAPDISHYQVYAAREPFERPTQERLVGSPSEQEMYDWGLKADATYHYAVTAVDRRGNESAPAFAQASTPAGEPRRVLTLTFDEAEREGPFDEVEAAATYGAFYVVPKDPETNAAAWRVEIPHDGEYYIWLRYLNIGTGRGGREYKDIPVLVDGRRATRLREAPDLSVPEEMLEEGHPLAPRLWTWIWPGPWRFRERLVSVELEAGEREVRVEELVGGVRYDALVISNDPAWQPPDGRWGR